MSDGDRPGAVEGLRARVLAALREVIDPELGLNVVDLGLVYGIEIRGAAVDVGLTMTSSACPLGEHVARLAEQRLGALPGIEAVTVNLVWDPPWSPERMSEAARQALGWER